MTALVLVKEWLVVLIRKNGAAIRHCDLWRIMSWYALSFLLLLEGILIDYVAVD